MTNLIAILILGVSVVHVGATARSHDLKNVLPLIRKEASLYLKMQGGRGRVSPSVEISKVCSHAASTTSVEITYSEFVVRWHQFEWLLST